MARPLSPAQKRSLVLEHRLRIDNRNIGELCEKYDLSKSAFQRIRKQVGHTSASKEELVIAGVYGGRHSVGSLIGYLDYRNHAVYSEAEVQSFLHNLVDAGVLVEGDGEWHFAPGSPAAKNAFVFTSPEGAALS